MIKKIKTKTNLNEGNDLFNELSNKYKNKNKYKPESNYFNKIKAFDQTFDIEYINKK